MQICVDSEPIRYGWQQVHIIYRVIILLEYGFGTLFFSKGNLYSDCCTAMVHAVITQKTVKPIKKRKTHTCIVARLMAPIASKNGKTSTQRSAKQKPLDQQHQTKPLTRLSLSLGIANGFFLSPIGYQWERVLSPVPNTYVPCCQTPFPGSPMPQYQSLDQQLICTEINIITSQSYKRLRYLHKEIVVRSYN